MSKEIGIDFGTTTTIVSYTGKNGKLKQLKYDGRSIIPSVLYYDSRDEYIIGLAAKNSLLLKAEAGVDSFKMKLGDTEYNRCLIADNGDEVRLTARKAATDFLQKIVADVSEKFIEEFGLADSEVERAVITMPAKFRQSAKNELKRVAEDIGLPAVKLTPEPTAAAIAYLDRHKDDDLAKKDSCAVLVYDFGGGTFDVSVVQKNGSKYTDVAPDGDPKLGGNDLTRHIVNRIIRRIEDDFNVDFPEDIDDVSGAEEKNIYLRNYREIWTKANKIKEELSETDKAGETLNLLLDGENKTCRFVLNRKQFEQMIAADIDHTVEITLRAIADAKTNGVEEIDAVVLAGGSSGIPLIRRKLTAGLPGMNIDTGEEASFLISRGAAILARQVEDIDSIAAHTTPMRIGTATKEGRQYNIFQPIIKENVPLPAHGELMLRLANDDLEQLTIHCYEHDVKNYPDATRVDRRGFDEIDKLVIDLKNLDIKRDDTKVLVSFDMQTDETLKITVELKDDKGNLLLNPKSQEVHVRRNSGLE